LTDISLDPTSFISVCNLIWKMIWGSDCHVTISYRDLKIIILNFILFKYMCTLIYKQYENNIHMYIYIGGVMVSSVLASSAVDHGFDPRSGQIKDYKIGMLCFSTKHTTLTRKSKDWLARNQENVSEWDDMSIRWLLFQWASTIKKI
jgi:hypothetical protein